MDDRPGPVRGHREATLLFPVVDDRVLLIHKKRGVGAGLYNAPGGKLEPGESPPGCAHREAREEVRADPVDVVKFGELDFRFGEDPFTYTHVFRAGGLTGDPSETSEADPTWFDVHAVPYDEMWPGDRYWLPHLLDGERFYGRFRFDEEGEELLDWGLDVEDADLDGVDS